MMAKGCLFFFFLIVTITNYKHIKLSEFNVIWMLTTYAPLFVIFESYNIRSSHLVYGTEHYTIAVMHLRSKEIDVTVIILSYLIS